MPPLWFDAHLDLACLAVNGRDMSAPPQDAGGPWPPGAVTLPSLKEGGVRAALATIFTEAGGDGPEGYPADDADSAHRRGRGQLEVYLSWRDEGLIAIDLPRALRTDREVGEIRAGMGVAQVVPADPGERLARSDELHIGVLIENADPIRTPDELRWWRERGVIAIGMAWKKPSRYAGGNATETGLTDLGRELAAAMDDLRLAHDLSHLSQRATEELLELTDRPVMASHSNCRALLDGKDQRHLADETIKEIGRRGGVVGLVLCSPFLRAGLDKDAGERATIDDCARHVERICELMGRRDGIGLGSDMDGGFSSKWLPEGIDRPRDLARLTEALSDRGWSDEELEGFRWRNWAMFFETNGPR